MRKIYLLIFPFSFSFLFSFSQTPDWVWARGAASCFTGYGEGLNIATDHSENLFITGYYTDTITFGSYILTGSSESFYVAKYDSSGNLKWAKGNTTGFGEGFGMCTDAFGSCYLTGSFEDTITFGSYTLMSGLYTELFLVKYDSSGNVLWAKGTTGVGSGAGISATSDSHSDSHGDIFITGEFSGSCTFGSYTLTSSVGNAVFTAKYDSSGNVLWAKGTIGTGNAWGNAVAVDASGNAYITGYFSSPTLSFDSYTLTNAGSYNIFFVKYDSSGNVLWAKSFGGINAAVGYRVATDALQNIYITGYFTSPSITFGSFTFINTGGGFLAKYDSSGNALWAKGIGGSSSVTCYSVAADKHGKVYLAGGCGFSVTFDTITLQVPTGPYDPMFIAGYDSSGNALFAKILLSGGIDWNAVAASPSGNIYVGGDFIIDPFIVGKDTFQLIGGNGTENPFVAKLGYSNSSQDINEIFNKEFILYPNPLTSSSILQFNTLIKNAEVVIYDMVGKEMIRKKLTGDRMEIKKGSLEGGVYLVKVIGEDGQWVAKLVVE